jgi:predicted secreted acid phosphatase
MLLLLALAGCAAGRPPAADPVNIGELQQTLIRYHDSGEYERQVAIVAQRAADYIKAEAPRASRPALVIDVDETALSNWPALAANSFGYFAPGPCDRLPAGPCGWRAWEEGANAPALAPILALYRVARGNRVAVFFITGRFEDERAITETNLRRAGYENWDGLFMRPAGSTATSAADFKAPARARIAALGYTILANIGDQPSDLAGGHAQRTFLLPNPFYRLP